MTKKIILINLMIVFILIISLELIFNFFKLSGLMGIQRGLIYSKNDNFFLSPNSSGIVFDEKVFTDKYGFRVPYENFDYSNKENIFVLGDSVAFGNGISEDKTFVGLLRNSIIKKNFLNSSVPGYQISHHVKNIEIIKNFSNVEKILYFFTLNDIYGSSNLVGLNNDNKINEGSFSLKNFKMLNRLNEYLRNKSYLYMYIKGISTDPSERWFNNLNNYYKNFDISNIKEQIYQLDSFSKKINSDFIVIILPYEYQTRDCERNDLTPQKKVSKVLKELDINFIDLTSSFCNIKNPKKYFYKFDPMHLSKNGHMLVFKSLSNEIIF